MYIIYIHISFVNYNYVIVRKLYFLNYAYKSIEFRMYLWLMERRTLNFNIDP